MKLFHLLSCALTLRVGGAYLVTPPGTAAPGSSQDCSQWVEQSYGITCAILEQFFGMTEAQFEAWNPITAQIGPNCTLIPDLYYCVQINYSSMSTLVTGPPTSSTTTSSSTSSVISTTLITTTSKPSTTSSSTSTSKPTTSTTSSGNGITTPIPDQAGIATNCNSFHFVVSGDTCAVIASTAGITLANFYIWNPAVGTTCASLWLSYYVCVGVIGSTPTTTTKATTTTSAGNGVATPTPFQAGMVTTCKTFHLVVSGDGCAAIATTAGVTLANFYAWNPTVGTTCASLWLGYYVCIGIL